MPVTDGYMSRIHFKIGWRENAFVVEDMGSSHGTLLNGRKLVGPSVLQDEDLIRAGQTDFVFQMTANDPVAVPAPKTVYGQPQTTVAPTTPSVRQDSWPGIEQQASAKTGPKPPASPSQPPSDVQISLPADPGAAIPLAELPASSPWDDSDPVEKSAIPTDDDWRESEESLGQSGMDKQGTELSSTETSSKGKPDAEEWDSIWDAPAVESKPSASDTNIPAPTPPSKPAAPSGQGSNNPTRPADPDSSAESSERTSEAEEDDDWWTAD